jgi:hypothetical protein
MGGLELEARLGNKVFGLLKLESVGMVPQAKVSSQPRIPGNQL